MKLTSDQNFRLANRVITTFSTMTMSTNTPHWPMNDSHFGGVPYSPKYNVLQPHSLTMH